MTDHSSNDPTRSAQPSLAPAAGSATRRVMLDWWKYKRRKGAYLSALSIARAEDHAAAMERGLQPIRPQVTPNAQGEPQPPMNL